MANSLRVQATNEIMQITAVLLLIQQTHPNTVLRFQPHLNKALLICEKTYIIQSLLFTRKIIFTVVTCILILSESYYQLMHKRTVLKGVLKFTLKQLQHNFFIITNLIHKLLLHSHKLFLYWNICFACLAMKILIFGWLCIIV